MFLTICPTVNLIMVYILLGPVGHAAAPLLVGTVRSHSSGDSGSGGGMIRLAVGETIYELDYFKQVVKMRFVNPACYDIGAIWKVTLDEKDRNIMASVQCSGEADERIHAPWLLVTEYFTRLSKKSTKSMDDMITDKYRMSEDYARVRSSLLEVDWTSYSYGRPGGCLEATDVVGTNSVTMLTSAGCYLSIGKRPIDLLLNVVRPSQGGAWRIANIIVI